MHLISFFCQYEFDPNSLWAFLTAFGTIALAIVGYKQINALITTNKDANSTAKEEFLHKLKKDFFTYEARCLLILLENDALKFEEIPDNKDCMTFKVDIPDTLKKYLKDSIDIKRSYYATQEIDDFLLQHLEDLGLLYEKKAVTIDDAIQQFQYYIKTIFENIEIKKYVTWAREQANDNDIYSKFEMIYHTVELEDTKTR